MINERLERLENVTRIAVRLASEFGIPPQVLIAQWAIESKWGSKPAGNANYFGIKKADRHTRCCIVPTHEVIDGESHIMNLEFADYASLEESCRDYAWLITHGAPYKAAWTRFEDDKDVLGLVASIAHTYATAPEYAHMAAEIASQSNVTAAIAAAQEV